MRQPVVSSGFAQIKQCVARPEPGSRSQHLVLIWSAPPPLTFGVSIQNSRKYDNKYHITTGKWVRATFWCLVASSSFDDPSRSTATCHLASCRHPNVQILRASTMSQSKSDSMLVRWLKTKKEFSRAFIHQIPSQRKMEAHWFSVQMEGIGAVGIWKHDSGTSNGNMTFLSNDCFLLFSEVSLVLSFEHFVDCDRKLLTIASVHLRSFSAKATTVFLYSPS